MSEQGTRTRRAVAIPANVILLVGLNPVVARGRMIRVELAPGEKGEAEIRLGSR